MLRTIIRLEKLQALRRRFLREGMLLGSTAAHFSSNLECDEESEAMSSHEDGGLDINGDIIQEKHGVEERLGDAGPENGPQSLSSITLASSPGISELYFQDISYSDYFVYIYQKDSIQRTSTSCLGMSMSLASHSHSSPSFIPCDTPIVQSQMTSKPTSISAARSRFFIPL